MISRTTTRRTILQRSAAALALPLMAATNDSPWFRISLAEWSLHRTLRAGDLKHLDFPRVSRERYGIDAVEYVSSFFTHKPTREAHVAELKQRAADAGVRSLLIMVDGEGALGDPSEGARKKAIENHRPWLDAAKELGCHSIRVNAQSRGPRDEQIKLAADGLSRLTKIGAEKGLNVIVENHGGHSSDGSWLSEVMRRVDHPRCGTLPDFGNFHLGDGKWYDRYKGVGELMPYAKAVSAKSHEFGADGLETGTDYRKMLSIVRAAGYRGWIGIEYEGGAHSEDEGVKKTRDLLIKLERELRGD